MDWTVHDERWLYQSDWVSLALVDVETPSGRRYEHHVVRYQHSAGAVISDPSRGVLLLWRHRFTTDRWGWEIPAGWIDPGESPEAAARREAVEETGWEPQDLTLLTTYGPLSGSSDATFHLFRSQSAAEVGSPVDTDESERIEWLSWAQVREEIAAGRVVEGLALTALLWVLAGMDDVS